MSEADVVRAKTSVEMTQDLMKEKHQKIAQIEARIHEKVCLKIPELILGARKILLFESSC